MSGRSPTNVVEATISVRAGPSTLKEAEPDHTFVTGNSMAVSSQAAGADFQAAPSGANGTLLEMANGAGVEPGLDRGEPLPCLPPGDVEGVRSRWRRFL